MKQKSADEAAKTATSESEKLERRKDALRQKRKALRDHIEANKPQGLGWTLSDSPTLTNRILLTDASGSRVIAIDNLEDGYDLMQMTPSWGASAHLYL